MRGQLLKELQLAAGSCAHGQICCLCNTACACPPLSSSSLHCRVFAAALMGAPLVEADSRLLGYRRCGVFSDGLPLVPAVSGCRPLERFWNYDTLSMKAAIDVALMSACEYAGGQGCAHTEAAHLSLRGGITLTPSAVHCERLGADQSCFQTGSHAIVVWTGACCILLVRASCCRLTPSLPSQTRQSCLASDLLFLSLLRTCSHSRARGSGAGLQSSDGQKGDSGSG